jgi:hypothetical protein
MVSDLSEGLDTPRGHCSSRSCDGEAESTDALDFQLNLLHGRSVSAASESSVLAEVADDRIGVTMTHAVLSL